jgi:hypothetical protein
MHNFALDMNWLPASVIPKRQWPAIRFKDKRAITWEEHCKIIQREKNSERKAFYQLAWHLGASQSDLANLQAEDVDWQARIICFVRMKTRHRNQQPPQIRFGKEVEDILAALPKTGAFFPWGLTSAASRCIRIATHERSARRSWGIQNGSHNWLWDITAKPSIAPMPKTPKSPCRRWKITSGR